MRVTAYDTEIRGDARWQTLCVADDEAGTVTKEVVVYQPGSDAQAALTQVWRQRLALQMQVKAVFVVPGTVLDLSVPVAEPPTKAEQEQSQWFAEKADFDTQAALARYPADFAVRYKPEYGRLW